MRPGRPAAIVALVLALALTASACGDDEEDASIGSAATSSAPDSSDDTTSSPEAVAEEPEEPAAAPEEPAADEQPEEPAAAPEEPAAAEDDTEDTGGGELIGEGTVVAGQPDVNGDGQVIIGIASPGDTNDGGFYENFVTGSRAFAEQEGWTVLVSDFINPADSETALADLARQNVDFLAVGATELLDGLLAVACEDEFAHIAMYINAAGSAPQNDCYGQSTDNYYQIHWVLGVAAAELLERTGGTKVGYIGGPELAFSTVAHRSMEAGLRSANPDAELVVTHTGSFNDAALGIEAARAMLDQEINVIYTFLGGAMFPTGGFVSENGGLAISASSNTCFPGSPFIGSSLFPPGDYLVANLREFAVGNYQEGVIREFNVGIDPEVGAVICDASPEEQAAIDEVVAMMASGELVPEDHVAPPG